MTEGSRFNGKRELDPLIGRTLSGRYLIRALVGQGGMGKVFEAQQIPLGRSVALKVLDASHVDREFHRRFFQEAAILARLKSRHTVTIYDYGRDGDYYFIAMELVAGPSLEHLLATEGPLEVARAVSIAEQVCRSLREAHAQGIIHRDLKPANVMLTVTEDDEELAKVLDFGLAKRTDQGSQDQTQAYIVPGSPKYMAPEAIHRRPIDGRLDMYALGVMLYYMLCGAVPFDRENPLDILRAHLHEQPRPLRVTNPNVQVPEALEGIVMRCLAKAPEGRFTDMQELLATLRAFSRGLRRPSAPSSAPARSSFPPGGGAGHGAPALGSGASISRQAPAAPLHLGLDPRDMRTSPPASFTSDARRARQIWFATTLAAVAILGVAVWHTARSNAETHARPAPVQPSPPAAPVAATATAPTMVITADEAAASDPRIALHVTSDPPGAGVFVNGKKLGFAPGDFEWTPEGANRDRPLIVQLRRTGYAPHTTKYAADTPRIDLDVKLQPRRKAVPSAAPPASEDDTSSESAEAALDESESTASEASENEAETADDNDNEAADDNERADPPAPPAPPAPSPAPEPQAGERDDVAPSANDSF